MNQIDFPLADSWEGPFHTLTIRRSASRMVKFFKDGEFLFQIDIDSLETLYKWASPH